MTVTLARSLYRYTYRYHYNRSILNVNNQIKLYVPCLNLFVITTVIYQFCLVYASNDLSPEQINTCSKETVTSENQKSFTHTNTACHNTKKYSSTHITQHQLKVSLTQYIRGAWRDISIVIKIQFIKQYSS